MFHCIMNSGRPFSSDVSALLLRTAQYLVERNLSGATITNKLCEGWVKTEGKHFSIGAIAGQLFEAELEIASGHTTVYYLVRTQDLAAMDLDNVANSEWMTPSEFEDHMREIHLRRSLS